MEERKDLAIKNQRSFSLEFKRRVVEEFLSGESRPAQLCRRYNITSSVLYHGRNSTAGASLTTSPPRKGLSGTG
jgi:transposase-like protein